MVAHLIIIDLEATCWPPGDPKRKQQSQISEIIELFSIHLQLIPPSIHYAECQEGLKYFHQLSQPVIHPTLSSFCIELTGISQEQVAQADPINVVLTNWINWIGVPSFYLASWGNMDDHLLTRAWRESTHDRFNITSINQQITKQDHVVHSLKERSFPPWQHINIQTLFENCCRAHRREQTNWHKHHNLNRISGLSLKDALFAINKTFTGPAHQARTDTIAALECLKFILSHRSLTPKEQFIIEQVQKNNQQGIKNTFWGESFRSQFKNKQEFNQTVRGLIKRFWLKYDHSLAIQLGALQLEEKFINFRESQDAYSSI